MIDGCIVVDSNNESPEDDLIFKGLTKNDIAFIKLIAPTNDSAYIKQSLKSALHGCIYSFLRRGNWFKRCKFR